MILFNSVHEEVVGTIKKSHYLPDQLKTKAIGVFFTLAVLVDQHCNAAYVRNKKHLASVCGGNIGEIELILNALEKLNLITWARTERCWILVINPYANYKLKAVAFVPLVADALGIYEEAKQCGTLSEHYRSQIRKFIDKESVTYLKSGNYETQGISPQVRQEDEDDGFGGFST